MSDLTNLSLETRKWKLQLVKSLKGLSHGMDLAFGDMHGQF